MNYQIKRIDADLLVSQIAEDVWGNASVIVIDTYWSGESAPIERRFEARILWSETALYVRFDANQNEPLIVSDKPNLQTKTIGLWDRDVCEIFLAPNVDEPRRYLEFEIAPNGEWLDLKIHQLPDKRETDWDYQSGMKSFASIAEGTITMAMKIEWKAFGARPQIGDAWMGNIFRCIGKDPTRGYLAWSPTFTAEPAFHVPEKFNKLQFDD